MATKKDPRRVKCEEELCALLDAFEPGKKNSDMYRRLFDRMGDSEFEAYMRRIAGEEEYMSIELDTAKKELTLDKIFNICDKIGIRTHKYVVYRDNKDSTGRCSITPHPALILYLPIKRLQQMVSKKNSASGDIDKINPLVGTVTGDSKSAGMNDTQVFGLISTGQTNTIKELLGPRADDEKSKQQLLHHIEERGKVSLKDLHIKPTNKQSIQTMRVFLKSVGIKVDIK